MAAPLLSASVRAVFFDAVGTLIHPEPPAPVVYHTVGHRFGSGRTLGEIGQRFRDAFQREEAIDQVAGLETNEYRELQRWRSIVGQVLDDVTDQEACFAELYEHFRRPESWRCDPEAAEVLSRLIARSRIVGLASNFDHRLHDVAAGLPALANVTIRIISSEIGWRKPAAHFYRAMCGSVDLPPEQVVLVGDDPVNDYRGARAAGLGALLLDPKGRAVGRAERIERLSEL